MRCLFGVWMQRSSWSSDGRNRSFITPKHKQGDWQGMGRLGNADRRCVLDIAVFRHGWRADTGSRRQPAPVPRSPASSFLLPAMRPAPDQDPTPNDSHGTWFIPELQAVCIIARHFSSGEARCLSIQTQHSAQDVFESMLSCTAVNGSPTMLCCDG